MHFLQIWIMPDRLRVTPRYQQKNFSAADKRGRLRLIISPDAAHGALGVYQDARVYAGLFDGAEQAEFEVPAGRYAYVHVARGSLSVNGTTMSAGDGARIREAGALRFDGGTDAEVLLFDLRPQELPR